MYNLREFEIDMMNGMSLVEIEERLGEEVFKSILESYDYMVEVVGDGLNEEYKFYEDEDIEVLKKYDMMGLVG